MKKSIAVLSLTIAGALGLAACSGNSGTNSGTNSSASASASASATASAPASTSAAAETTKAETKTTQGTISTPSGLPSEATEALKKSEDSNQQETSAFYSAVKESLNDVKKVQTSDGTVYYNYEVAVFETKDGAIVIIKNTGAWSRFDSNGGTIVVEEDGSWIKTNPEDNLYTAVKADGAAAVLNTKTLEQTTDLSTIEIPKAPARIDGFRGTAKTPAKPTKVGNFSEITGL